ncbi:UV-stimulated scaffold protein A-like [Haliotis rufescens]|uniref:UV-stimulated scaffold protein A-like n=1 Tax=Haliotis rufescens TaxID=6454 RepID=UPI00201E9AF7|nr:UV-stimulated scaffold protein A-like [Haliotis rufescens]
MEGVEECLDDSLRVEMEKCVQKLTMSGKPKLDTDVMKQFKKICKKSNTYVKHAYHILMIELEKNHAEVRLSTFQIIDELFNRSHEFRELLISNLQVFMELTVDTNPEMPLPPPKPIAQTLKRETLKAIQQWQEKYGDAYKKLTLGYHYLRSCKMVDFNDIRSRTIAERRRSEEKERRKQNIMRVRLERVLQDIEEGAPDMENAAMEVENCLQLLLPAPDNFFICDDDDDDDTPDKSGEAVAASDRIKPNEEQEGDKGPKLSESTLKHEDSVGASGSTSPSATNTSEPAGTATQEAEEDDEDDFEDVPDAEGFVQAHGLGSRQYNISIDMQAVEAFVQETDDNKDIFNTLKDAICLIAIKYIPLVGRWLEILSKNGASEADIKRMIDLKNKLLSSKTKCDELQVLPAVQVGKKKRSNDSDDDDDFEVVPEKEGYEPNIPQHLRAEYGLEPQPESVEEKKKAPEKFMAQMTPQFWSMSTIKSMTSYADPTSREANISRLKGHQQSDSTVGYSPGRSKHPLAGISRETSESGPSTSGKTTPAKKARADAPVVPFGADLACWDNPDAIEAPVMIKYDSLHRFWVPPESETEKPNALDLAAVKNRTFHFTGTFEPVKWKCRAPMATGGLCERMDRVKCPFHGKVIARDEEGRPARLNDALEIAKQAEKNAEEQVPDWQDPQLLREIEASTGLDLQLKKYKDKGKGKGKGKKKKYGSLTDIDKIKDTSRSRLERKVFNASAVRRVTSRMDAADYRRVRDKFGNQFNYSLS